MIVMKFAGSPVADAERIRNVLEIVKGRLAKKPVVVCSALKGVTDELFKLADEAVKGRSPGIEKLETRHQDLMIALGVDTNLLDSLYSELSVLLKGISLVKELT